MNRIKLLYLVFFVCMGITLNAVKVKNTSEHTITLSMFAFSTPQKHNYLAQIELEAGGSEYEFNNAEAFALATEDKKINIAFMRLQNHHTIIFDGTQAHIIPPKQNLEAKEMARQVSVKKMLTYYTAQYLKELR